MCGMNYANYLRMVLWSFFGIRRRAEADRELPRAHPLVLLATAVGLAAALVGTLVSVAHVAVRAAS